MPKTGCSPPSSCESWPNRVTVACRRYFSSAKDRISPGKKNEGYLLPLFGILRIISSTSTRNAICRIPGFLPDTAASAMASLTTAQWCIIPAAQSELQWAAADSFSCLIRCIIEAADSLLRMVLLFKMAGTYIFVNSVWEKQML